MAKLVTLCGLLCLALPAYAADKLAVMPLAQKRVAKETAEILDELLLNAIARRGGYEVIGTSDMNAMLGLERMRDAAGCDDVACAAEIGGALGVRYLVAGSVSRLGDEVIVVLKRIDVQQSQVSARGEAHVPDDENRFRQAIEDATATLFGDAPAVVGGGGGTESVALSGPMYQRFMAYGLDRNSYIDFATSGLDYKLWAMHHNDASESWVLEVSKWVCTGTTALILATTLAARDPDEGVGTAIFVSTPMALSTLALWIIDLVNIGNAPSEMPDS